MMTNSFEIALAEENLMANVQAMALRIMREKNISQLELAERMNVSESRVSQLLDEDEPKNITLKVIARVFHSLEEKLNLSTPTIEALNERAKVRLAEHRFVFEQAAKSAWRPIVPRLCDGVANDLQLDEPPMLMSA